jgi:hypothetical protein
MAPLASACGAGWSIGRNHMFARSPHVDGMAHDGSQSGPVGNGPALEWQSALPRVMVLAIEPAGVIDGDADGPVVFPGYLLPDDTFEDVSHEGS